MNPQPDLPPGADQGNCLMRIQDVFRITGRGTVATGRIERGLIHAGSTATILSQQGRQLRCRIVAIEMRRQRPSQAREGDSVGLVLDVEHDAIARGDALINVEPVARG